MMIYLGENDVIDHTWADKTWLICDLDGTLCNTEHRDQFARERNWDEFNGRLHLDEPNQPVLDFVRLFRTTNSNHRVMALTARNSSMLGPTSDWMMKHSCLHLFDVIRMRPAHNKSESDADLKPRLLFNFFLNKETALKKVFLILDDRDRVVKSFREHGFPVWQVKEGAY